MGEEKGGEREMNNTLFFEGKREREERGEGERKRCVSVAVVLQIDTF